MDLKPIYRRMIEDKSRRRISLERFDAAMREVERRAQNPDVNDADAASFLIAAYITEKNLARKEHLKNLMKKYDMVPEDW